MPASHSDQNRLSIIILGVLFLHHHHHHNDIVPSPPSSSQLYCSITTIITTIILVSWPDPNSSQPPQCNSSNHNFLTLRYFQGYLLYGYGGKKLYEYSVFKPLEGYFKWPDLKWWPLSDSKIIFQGMTSVRPDDQSLKGVFVLKRRKKRKHESI